MTGALPLPRLAIIPLFSITLSVVVAALAWPTSLRSPGARSFAWWLVLGATFNLISLLTTLYGINNHLFFQWYRLFSVLLLSLTAYHLLPERVLRRTVIGIAVLFVCFWLAMTLAFENLSYFSKFTSPAATGVELVFGILMVVRSIRLGNRLPLALAATWIGLGLVLEGGTRLVASPLIGELAHRSLTASKVVGIVVGLIGTVGLFLALVPYRKRGIVWTD